LRAFNEANRTRGFPAIEAIEGAQLVGRFLDAHGEYFPTELEDLSRLLALLLERGDGPFPVARFSDVIAELHSVGDHATGIALQRAIASSTLFTAYLAGPWQRAENHLGVAEAWLSLAIRILFTAQSYDLAESHWRLSFELARDSGRAALRALLSEASSAEDLAIPDIVEGLVYPSRAMLVCGYCSAFLISELELGDDAELRDEVATLLARELERARATGEAAGPFVLLAAIASELLGEQERGFSLVVNWVLALSLLNHPDKENGVPDPYHSINETLLAQVDAGEHYDGESFVGEAYTLHVAVEWLARRDLRGLVEQLWPLTTYLHFVEYRPGDATGYLSQYDDGGTNHTWAPGCPQSWSELSGAAKQVNESELPMLLWQHLYMLPYLIALLPYRLTSCTGKALDFMASGLGKVNLDSDLS
jgi:hypothetical protein